MSMVKQAVQRADAMQQAHAWLAVLNFGVFWLAFRLGTARDIGWRPMCHRPARLAVPAGRAHLVCGGD
jgi:hypothetical protein